MHLPKTKAKNNQKGERLSRAKRRVWVGFENQVNHFVSEDYQRLLFSYCSKSYWPMWWHKCDYLINILLWYRSQTRYSTNFRGQLLAFSKLVTSGQKTVKAQWLFQTIWLCLHASFICVLHLFFLFLITRATVVIYNQFSINCYSLENSTFLGIIIRSVLLTWPPTCRALPECRHPF